MVSVSRFGSSMPSNLKSIQFTALRVDWAKAKSRADRWEEEVRLLDEEMRRVLVYNNWKAEWWRSQVGFRDDIDEPTKEGLQAYAEEHAMLAIRQAGYFGAKWYAVRLEARVLIEKAFGVSAVSELLIPDNVHGSSSRLELDPVDEDPDEAAMDSDFEE